LALIYLNHPGKANVGEAGLPSLPWHPAPVAERAIAVEFEMPILMVAVFLSPFS